MANAEFISACNLQVELQTTGAEGGDGSESSFVFRYDGTGSKSVVITTASGEQIVIDDPREICIQTKGDQEASVHRQAFYYLARILEAAGFGQGLADLVLIDSPFAEG